MANGGLLSEQVLSHSLAYGEERRCFAAVHLVPYEILSEGHELSAPDLWCLHHTSATVVFQVCFSAVVTYVPRQCLKAPWLATVCLVHVTGVPPVVSAQTVSQFMNPPEVPCTKNTRARADPRSDEYRYFQEHNCFCRE